MFSELIENSGIYSFITGNAGSNSYLIYNAKGNRIEENEESKESKESSEKLIIDPGMGNELKLIHSLKALSIKPDEITHVFLTHGHADHFSNAVLFPKARIYMHPYDALRVNARNEDFTCSKYFEKINFPKITDNFQDKEKFNLNDLSLEVIYSPGHTKGSVCFYCKKHKVLFSGDTIFNKTHGRTDLPSGSIDDLERSLKKLQEIDYDILCSGHNSILKLKNQENLMFALQNLRAGKLFK